MKYRWTIEELDSFDHVRFPKALIDERKNANLNPYAPLYRRLEETREWLGTVKTDLPRAAKERIERKRETGK